MLLLVHARLPQAYTALQYVKAVALPCDASSELGYVLCTFEGAVEFVRTCGPEAFQEPLEPIEEAGAEREPSGAPVPKIPRMVSATSSQTFPANETSEDFVWQT